MGARSHEINKMLEMDLMKRTQTCWAVPIGSASKKIGTLRFCVNYHGLNALTTRYSKIIPCTYKYIDTLGYGTIHSMLDAKSSTWQVEVANEGCNKSALVTQR